MKVLYYIILPVVIICAYSAINVYRKIQVSKKLISQTKPFKIDGNDYSKTLLVLGDSTAVGVGASTPEESVPGLLAKSMGATYLENLAVSGALVNDLYAQLEKVKLMHYDYILIQIGGNDIVRFHNTEEVTSSLGEILSKLPKTEKINVVCCGDVGVSTIFPSIIRPFYTKKTLDYHKAFGIEVPKHGASYTNLYVDPRIDPFVLHPEIYIAEDQFHPSSEGYKLWFNAIITTQ